MSRARIASIAIIGGGPAGWLSAATLARVLKPDYCDLRLIDLPRSSPGTISECALPSFHRLNNNLLGINESDLMQRTGATFKLGTRFVDWDRIGHAYFHTFAPFGAKLEAVPFHQHWLRLSRSGRAGRLEDYSTATVAARQGRFAPPATDRQSVLSLYSYGYHFGTDSLAAYLRDYAQSHGVTRIDRSIVEARLRGEDGFVDQLLLDDGTSIRADLYLDCRDAAQLAMQPLVETAHVDWSAWLPCDRAVALPCTGSGEPAPYSQAAARPYGWRWHQPLQQCIDSGYAYSSQYLSDEQASAALLEDLPGTPLAEPRAWRFSTGHPARFWDRNWLRLPGSSLEPLECTGLHLVQTGITRLLSLFPVHRHSPDDAEEYNRLTLMEYERVRDYLILHYKATARSDSPFWEYCRHMPIPDSLRAKMELFQDSARMPMLEEEHFGEDSWLSVLLGQGIEPRGYDPLADVLGIEEASSALAYLKSKIEAAVATLPMHGAFLSKQCRARVPGAE
jgi:tryptophan halogenase